jgi:hypothetical protein
MALKELEKLSADKRNQAAKEGGYLLNEAIRDLLTPARILRLSDEWLSHTPLPLKALAAVRHLAVTSVVMNIFRLKEIRGSFIEGWLIPDERLRALGFPPVEEFIGAGQWNLFVVVRHQYAGHATGKEGTFKYPGRIVPASLLGKAIREAGLLELESLLGRVQKELVPAVERVRDEIYKLYPVAKEFVITYALELERATHLKSGEGS